VNVGAEARRRFHDSLGDLRTEIVQLAALVTEAIPRATRALLDMDLSAARTLIGADDEIDERAQCVEEEALRLLTLQQPMAGDLRAVVTAVKLSWEIERSGDLVVNICKVASRLRGTTLDPRIRGLLERMSEQSHALTCRAVDAYATGDVALAAALDDMDDDVDDLHADYIRTIFEVYEGGDAPLQVAVQLALVGRYYERIGDHAVNIGERVRYMVTGWLPEHTGAARLAAKRAAHIDDMEELEE
jgi:phosphate transport system protein